MTIEQTVRLICFVDSEAGMLIDGRLLLNHTGWCMVSGLVSIPFRWSWQYSRWQCVSITTVGLPSSSSSTADLSTTAVSALGLAGADRSDFFCLNLLLWIALSCR